MKTFLQNLKGDRSVWGVVILMAIYSIVVVYSAVSNLAWHSFDGGNVFSLIFKHFFYLILGFATMYAAHKIPYKFFSSYSTILLPVAIILLLFTLMQGKQIAGANASRWIQVPFLGMSIQTSTVASIIMFTYVARYLAKTKDKVVSFKYALIWLWSPIALVVGLILPANFSTAALLVLNIGVILIIGGYPFKQLFTMFIVGIAALSLFVSMVVMFPKIMPNRVHTWAHRVGYELTTDGVIPIENDKKDDYQEESAKIAIAMGGVLGQGPGKSVQKNHLPQSSSDFIFAIITEEFGFVGVVFLMMLYITFLIRVVIISNKAPTMFGSLLVLALGIPIISQALVNMLVAVGIFPVTGQPLPFVSNGGTSILMISFAVGMILSVSRETQELQENESLEIEVEEEHNELISSEFEGVI
jgi:cell division protein FtsW